MILKSFLILTNTNYDTFCSYFFIFLQTLSVSGKFNVTKTIIQKK